MTENLDCIIIGAGAAGLSAALVLGRARRRTLVIDAGGQSNRPAGGIGGLLGHDGRAPADFYAAARTELAAYPSVQLRDAAVTGARRDGETFVVEPTGETADRLLLATGMDYRVPELPGIAERWGGSVFHCPFCHGWEHRDEALAVLGNGPMAVHRARLLTMWSDDVTLLTNGPAHEVDPGLSVDERPISHLDGPGDALRAIVFADGSERPCGGLLVPVTLHQRGGLAEQLGATLAEPGPLVADAVSVDERCRTSVPGLYAAGDASAQMQSVAGAVAAGHMAAATIVADIVASGPR